MLKNSKKCVVELPRLVEPKTPLTVESHPETSSQRGELESFIRQVFHQAYGAQIHTFYPSLIGINRPDSSFAAVAGIRAASESLFAEQYLDRPIERLLAERGHLVRRQAIVEVGNLAPASAGQARWLIATMTAYLHAAGFSWVVFTAVPALHNAFLRMGLPLTALADADRSRLDPELQDNWGRYYDGRPRVYAGYIRTGYNALNRQIGPNLPKLQALWLQAQEEGRHYGQQLSDFPSSALLS